MTHQELEQGQLQRSARLVLEDGAVFSGLAFGAVDVDGPIAGEVVFNTAMVGYQEALTDPSYAGQILVMTNPMIGNYGVAEADVESSKPQVAGFVVRELSRIRSNFRSFNDLHHWLAQAGVPAIAEIDTRALVRRLRNQGALRGVIAVDSTLTDAELVDAARAAEPMSGRNLVRDVSTTAERYWEGGLDHTLASQILEPERDQPRFNVVAIDCGGKHNIYRHLTERGCRVEVVPHDISADAIRSKRPDGLFISNGPGDPAAVAETVAVLKEIAGEIPTFGICLGHQLLALGLGARTYKLKFGHRGANQPVRNLLTGHVEITSQNHGFCVDPESVQAAGLEVTHIHLNDGTVAGFRHPSMPILSVQFHPEASPGPHDSAYLFDCFLKMMESGKPILAEELAEAQAAQATVSVD